MSKKIRMQRIAVIIAIVTATVILPVAAQAQTKDDFEYWDLNGNSDLTCTEASGKDEGLKLPAYRDNRDGTGLIYEWLQRQRSSDTDNDGIGVTSKALILPFSVATHSSAPMRCTRCREACGLPPPVAPR